mmetsp:Transcript_47451/g.76126  ORF Transcript_47451/g.76126 Transcript_47451/m.76126 type:complete len:493 (-) Transcript_47451:169-1647(-)
MASPELPRALSKEQQLAEVITEEIEYQKSDAHDHDGETKDTQTAQIVIKEEENEQDEEKEVAIKTEPKTNPNRSASRLSAPGMEKTKSDEEYKEEDHNYNAKYFNEKKNRTSTRYTNEKMPCWMSMDVHLVDIQLAQEIFIINAWLLVFFKDINGEFEALFDDESLEHIKSRGFIAYDDLSVKIRKKLPLKSSFLLNCANLDIRRAYLEVYNESQNVWKLYFRFNAECGEHMELHSFPFDAQFLNIQMVYRIQDFYFLSKCPDWMLFDDQYMVFKLDKPIKLTVKDSIKSQWTVEEPWIDLREDRGKDYKFHFSVIRLRVRREPSFYMVNAVLPLFLVVSCSFASFVMPVDEFVNDKLGYIITLLLTVTAFQYAISADLPKTSETTMLDMYILTAFFLLAFFTLEIATVYQIFSAGYPTVAAVVDYVTVGVFAFIWLYISGRFVVSYWKLRNRELDWDEVSHEEMKSWSKDMKGDSKYIGHAKGRFFGTRDK